MLQQNISDSFNDLYNRHFEAVYKICYIYMKNAYDAEDCTEDTFLKVLKSDTNFNDEKHERALLTVMAKNICKDKLKNWWRKKITPIDDYEESLKENSVEHDDTLDAVMALPVKYKDVVYLYYYEAIRRMKLQNF